MAYLEWDDAVEEDVFINPSQALLDSPLWDNVDVVNQTVLPTGTDVMGNENYPQNIDSTNYSNVPQMDGGIGGALYG